MNSMDIQVDLGSGADAPESSGPTRRGKLGTLAKYDSQPVQLLIDRHMRLRYPYHCEFGAARLEILKGVFCPTLTRASPLLLEAVSFKPGQRVLDVFAGSGAFAINAALSGADAVTVDISARAVCCTRRNATLNRVQGRVDARLGTMESCLRDGERFDVIVANPPLLPGDRADMLTDFEMALCDPGFGATIAFLQGIRYHLSAGGHAYLLTSDVLDRYHYDVDRLAFANNLDCMLVAKRDVGYETYRVHDLTLTPPKSA